MKVFNNVLRDRSVNNLTVAVLIGFSTVNFIQFLANTVGVQQGPPRDTIVRQIIQYVGTLLLAWIVSWFAK